MQGVEGDRGPLRPNLLRAALARPSSPLGLRFDQGGWSRLGDGRGRRAWSHMSSGGVESPEQCIPMKRMECTPHPFGSSAGLWMFPEFDMKDLVI